MPPGRRDSSPGYGLCRTNESAVSDHELDRRRNWHGQESGNDGVKIAQKPIQYLSPESTKKTRSRGQILVPDLHEFGPHQPLIQNTPPVRTDSCLLQKYALRGASPSRLRLAGMRRQTRQKPSSISPCAVARYARRSANASLSYCSVLDGDSVGQL